MQWVSSQRKKSEETNAVGLWAKNDSGAILETEKPVLLINLSCQQMHHDCCLSQARSHGVTSSWGFLMARNSDDWFLLANPREAVLAQTWCNVLTSAHLTQTPADLLSMRAMQKPPLKPWQPVACSSWSLCAEAFSRHAAPIKQEVAAAGLSVVIL